MSRSVIEASLGTRPDHLSYPVGDKTSAGPREFKIAAELGFKTAVTTRPGVLFPSHSEHLTALPRQHLIAFQLSHRRHFDCRIANQCLSHEPANGALAICPAGVDCTADALGSVDAILVAVEPVEFDNRLTGERETNVLFFARG